MAIWSADLTTEDGALGAAQMGSVACLIAAGFAGFYLLVGLGVASGANQDIGTTMAVFFAFELIVFGLSAFLLRQGKGAIPAVVAAVLLGLEALLRLAGLAIIPLIFDVVLLIFTINGVRGALALRKGIVNEEEIFS